MAPQFVKKKVDSRIRTMVENGVQVGHRSLFVIVGDRGKDQVMYLHYMLSKARVAVKPSVLWCYKKELGFSSHRKKRMKQQQAMIKKGIREADHDDPFELFIAGTNIRYCYYKETEKILGNTFGMCVLQDFEALTPNLLARTIETVEGGGVVVLLLRTLKSLKQLYTLTMDVHSRYRTEAHGDVVSRFNERFILSLGSCEQCLVVDDELNVLPLSQGRAVVALPNVVTEDRIITDSEKEMFELKESVKDTQPIGTLIKQAKTLDQTKALLTFIEAISEKRLRGTVTLTAARGRGKSAALGVAIAAAVAYGYSNIFVTSPSPENLNTLFEFIFKSFDSLGYTEHLDFDIVQSINPDFHKAVVRVNIFKEHRQTIQYIQPQDAHVLGQAELLVIDEAAAIPLPLVKKLLGSYLVFMASTINGYEGTGRSLSLKLIQQLREQTHNVNDASNTSTSGRTLREIKLEEPIRYAEHDPTERWLNQLLCLDASIISRSLNPHGCPHPDECELFYVNRDTLFSYHAVSEAFLQRIMALMVSSHYKNTPNDLQLLSDAPAHQLFVLLPPVKEVGDDGDAATVLPEPLVVIQVCLEGKISKASVMASLNRGRRADGDLIPWTISQQFQDDDFPSMSGARVVRIATHPDYIKMGYGSRALTLLTQYFEEKLLNLDEAENSPSADNDEFSSELGLRRVTEEALQETILQTERVQVRDTTSMPPLLLTLSEMPPPRNLHWLGVSYGITGDLLRFWKRASFLPVYLRQSPNELTGEHSCIMIRTLERDNPNYDARWLFSFNLDFQRRFLRLLGYEFKSFSPTLSLTVLENPPKLPGFAEYCKEQRKPLQKHQLDACFSSYDLKRLGSYANSMLDYHVIMDTVSIIASHYFEHRLAKNATDAGVELSAVQKAILLALGLQFKSIDAISSELSLPVSQILALFIRTIRRVGDFYTLLNESELADPRKSEHAAPITAAPLETNGVENGPRDIHDATAWDPTLISLEEDLIDGAKEVESSFRQKQRELVDSLDLSRYAIMSNDAEWDRSTGSQKNLLDKTSGVVSVKNMNSSKSKRKHTTTVEEVALEGRKMMEKARGKKKNKK